MDAFPDLDSLTDQGLKALIVELKAEEERVSIAGGERNERAPGAGEISLPAEENTGDDPRRPPTPQRRPLS